MFMLFNKNSILIRQIKFYMICGAISTSFDFVIYFMLYKQIGVDIAKGSSFLVATCISYFLNKHITFNQKSKSHIEKLNFFILHVFTMLIDVSLNRTFLILLGGFIEIQRFKIISAFICATSISVIVNFLCQKYWVFRNKYTYASK